MMIRPSVFWSVVCFGSLFIVGAAFGEKADFSDCLRADWLAQAAPGDGAPTTKTDALGAVDGVKNGKYGFHAGLEPNPWWQVDLGKPVAISRIRIYNREDYAPGLHNADRIEILVSNNGEDFRTVFQNQRHFGSIGRVGPLEVRFQKGSLKTRFVRLRIPSPRPVFFHLDEVEVFGEADPDVNIALKRPADQSSISQWSTTAPFLPEGTQAEYPTADFLRRGRLLLAEYGIDSPDDTAELDRLEAEYKKLTPNASEAVRKDLYLRVRKAVRKIVFANPLLDFPELLTVKRFCQETYPDVCLNHMPWVSRPGGDICILTLAGPDAEPEARPLLQNKLGPGHVHGLDLSYDAKRIVFGYAKKKTNKPPEGWLDRRTNFRLRREVEPTHIFEIGVDGTGLRQVTDGTWTDIDPTYLPDGKIAFISERCGCSLQCNEWDKDETSCNLYSCNPDGSEVTRLSVSKDGDYLPHVLDDGTIGYTRWEYQERGWAHIQSIWFIRPDGTGADALFAQHLNDPWSLEDVRSIPGTRPSKLVAVAAGHHTLEAGPVVVLTPSVGLNDSAGIRIVTPSIRPPEGGMSGTPVDEEGVDDPGGFYMHPWPLSEKFFLVSYSSTPNRGVASEVDATGYAIYLIDVFGNKELIYRDPDISCFRPIPLRRRPKPTVIASTPDPARNDATLYLADATHGTGLDPGRAKYLRIAHRLQWPYDHEHGGQRYAEKASPNNWTPVRILGTVPLGEDGSAYFRVPSDTPVYFQLLDENHMELRRMRSFISFQPGERRGCVGCHETREEAPGHVAKDLPKALLGEPAVPAPPPWGTRPISFLREIQPILDKHCVSCHTGLKPAGDLDFSGGLTTHPSGIPGYGHNRAFETIMANGLVSCSPVQGDAAVTQPLQFGSHHSRLVKSVTEGTCPGKAKLDETEMRTLVTWIDANAPYHDGFVNKRAATKPYDLAADKLLLEQIRGLHLARCRCCHQDPSRITRADWIDLHHPERSLFLIAPLAKSAGGTERCGRVGYTSKQDPNYQAILFLVERAVKEAKARPRRDVAGAFLHVGESLRDSHSARSIQNPACFREATSTGKTRFAPMQ